MTAFRLPGWLRALLASLIANAPAIYLFVLSSGRSERLFSDWDEPLYLRWSLALGSGFLRGDLAGALAAERSDLPMFLFPNRHTLAPSVVSDVVIGAVGSIAGLSPIAFGLALDVVIFAAFFYLVRRAFRILTESSTAADVATIIFALVPWLATPAVYANLASTPPELRSYIVTPYVCSPVFRGTATQASWVLYGAWFLAIARMSRSKGPLHRYYYSGGALAGLSLYVYFFAWGAMTAVGAGLAVLEPLWRGSRRVPLGSILRYVGTSLAVALPGLILILRAGTNPSWDLSDSARGFYYVRPEVVSLLVVTTVVLVLLRRRLSGGQRTMLALLASSVAAEIVLMNVQPLLGKLFVPGHFPMFYLHPLNSALFAALLAGYLANAGLKLPLSLLGALVLVMVPIAKSSPLVDGNEGDYYQLLSALERETAPGTSVTIMPYAKPFVDESPECIARRQWLLPFWIRASAPVATLPLPRGRDTSDPLQSELNRQLLVGWLYSGRMMSPKPCSRQRELPGDIVGGGIAIQDRNWHEVDRLLREGADSYDPCRAIDDFEVELVLWFYGLSDVRPPMYDRFFEPVWKSDSGAFELFRFDPSAARAALCAG